MELVEASYPHPLRADAHGVVRVGATRVTLASVIGPFEQGASAEEIALRFDTLTLGEVYGALSFYLANRSAVADYLRSEQEASAQARGLAEKRSPFIDLRRRLSARRSA